MRWERLLIFAIALSFSTVAVSVCQDTTPANEPGTQVQKEEPQKDGTAAPGQIQAKGQDEGKSEGASQGKNADSNKEQVEGKAEGQANPNAEGQPNADKNAAGKTGENKEAQGESKTTESKTAPAAPSAPESDLPGDVPAKAQANGGSDKQAGTAQAGSEGAADAMTNPNPATAAAPVLAPHKKPQKVVVREGGAREPAAQIVAGMTVAEASSERQETEKLLDSAEENLRRLLGRTLDAQQQETVSQIHNYLGRAHSALKEGDFSRGHMLAMKANLLAEDLVQH